MTLPRAISLRGYNRTSRGNRDNRDSRGNRDNRDNRVASNGVIAFGGLLGEARFVWPDASGRKE